MEEVSMQREIYLPRNRLRACIWAELKFREDVELPERRQRIANVVGKCGEFALMPFCYPPASPITKDSNRTNSTNVVIQT